MLRQVPATWLIAASMVLAVRSGILRSAISLTCALVMVATLSLLGTPEPFSMPQRLQNEGRSRGGLGDEGEAAVGVNGDDNRNLEAGLILGTLVELLDELGNVNAVLAESRTDRGRSGCLCGRNLKLDITCYFLCHDKHLLNKCGDTRRWRISGGLNPSHVPVCAGDYSLTSST